MKQKLHLTQTLILYSSDLNNITLKPIGEPPYTGTQISQHTWLVQ